MVQQTIQLESVSLSEIGSGAITAFLFSGTTLAATLANIMENGTLKGRYTGTVDDIAAAEYRLVVKFNGFTVNEPDEVVTLLLAVGTYVAERHAVLNTAQYDAIIAAAEGSALDADTKGQINRIEATTSGTLTGAGTSTEVFVGPSATVTITVDASGNRSAVVVT